MEKELTIENIINGVQNDNGFSSHNNIHIESLTKEKSVLYADITKESLNPHGIVHGGLIYGIADNAMGTLAFSSGRPVVTVDSNINYLRPCRGPRIKCVAEVVKLGGTLGVYKASVYNEREDLAAVVTGTYYFLDRDINK